MFVCSYVFFFFCQHLEIKNLLFSSPPACLCMAFVDFGDFFYLFLCLSVPSIYLENKLPALAPSRPPPKHCQHQRLLFFLQPPKSQTRQGLASWKTGKLTNWVSLRLHWKKFIPLAPEVVLPFIESILVRIVSHPELAQKNSDDVLTSLALTPIAQKLIERPV